MNAPPRRPAESRLWILAVLVAGIALSLGLFLHLRDRERREAADAASNLARQQVERLRISLLRSIEVLHSIAALHAVQGPFTRAQFHDFVQSALSRQPELQALSWNPVVPHTQRASFEAAARTEGLTEFALREARPDGQLQPAEPRPDYVPVRFIEPLASNRAALGFDLASDPSRRASLEQARLSGAPVATAPIQLAQGPTNSAGVLVVLPVLAPHPTSTTPPPLAGYAVAVFRIEALVGTAFRELERAGFRAELFDESPEPDRILAPAQDPDTPNAPSFRASLEFAGRRWAVVFRPTPQHTHTRPPRQSFIVLAIALAFTLSTCAHLVRAHRRTGEIARANAALREEVAVRQRAEAAAAAANRAKSDFLTSMSHEIRTPLNAILGHVQLMQRDPRISPEQADAVAGIQSGGHHLLGLVNEVLDLARIEAGRLELHPTHFDPTQLARAIAATFHPLCFQQHIDFRLELHGTAPSRVHGDESKLRQILFNLVGNALKFTPSGGVQVHFRPSNTPPHHWLFEVLDTGLGIPEEEQPHIFEPFHQVDRARHPAGTGLGLAIARRQVELLGGTLAFESERGVGSRFHFSVPLPPSPATTPHSPSPDRAGEPVPIAATPPAPAEATTAPHLELPADLFSRLSLAAELHSSTALKACLPDLRLHGADAVRFADHLRWLLRSYDMQGIQLALSRVRVHHARPTPQPPPPPPPSPQ